jgi:hypothetical protein
LRIGVRQDIKHFNEPLDLSELLFSCAYSSFQQSASSFAMLSVLALTPLFHGHINPYGQFALDLARPSFLEAA